ncbi:MAG: hypothetical protein AAGA20_17715 [Planctomycetota bacterium]
MMQEVLQPLTLQAGVRLAAVISGDGVPVCVLERSSSGTDEFVDCTTSSQPSLEGQRIDPASLVALAASWVDDLMRAGGQIAWEIPKRFVLVASQGTLVVQQGPNAHVMVVLEMSAQPEDFVLPLEAAVERLHRLLRDLGRFDPDQNAPALPRPSAARATAVPSLSEHAAGDDPGRSTLTDTTGGASAAAGGLPNGTTGSAQHDTPGDH